MEWLPWACPCGSKKRGHCDKGIWKVSSTPERCPLAFCRAGFSTQIIPSLPFASAFGWWGILQDFLPHPILWPTYLHSFQFWTDIINGNKSFPAYKFNTETAEIVSWWQKEETSPYNLPCKQSAPSITAFSHANLGGDLIYDLNWASLGKHVTSEPGFRNFYLHSS